MVGKTRKAQKTNKGEPTLNPNAVKVNTVRRGTNGYWWSAVKSYDPNVSENERDNLWVALGTHTRKQPVWKKTKIEMNEYLQNSLNNDGVIKVSFNLTPGCEKSGELPKSCDLEREGRAKHNPVKRVGWTFTAYDYASLPTDKYKYVHNYGGSLAKMDKAVAMLKKHYGEHKRTGAITNFCIKTETFRETQERLWIL